jgi:hypothetical protein
MAFSRYVPERLSTEGATSDLENVVILMADLQTSHF